ncbi:hypothetical protein A5700_18115 [Mycobacterium sp. E1214]|nr:hypothetical protein A5700_18115 [Mycobacterium sp. E1214]OBH26136.1 hypothetical protein A5693_04540 [Mycobacterium sp. E1319]
MLEQHLPGWGEDDAARTTFQQGDTQVSFQGLNLLRQRRRSDPQPAGCPPEVPFLGHGNEIPELSELHTQSR